MFARKSKNKKGNIIADSFIIILILLIFAFFIPFFYQFMTGFNTSLQTSEFSSEGKSTFNTITTQFPAWVDSAVLFGLIILWIGSLVASFMIDSHPIFFVITMILWIFLLIEMTWVSNAYEDVVTNSNIVGFTNQFPYTFFIMTHIVEFMIAIGLTIGIALFAKSRQ